MSEIIRADASHVDVIAPLFDAYRQFYEQAADLKKARDFIEARLKNDDCVIFLAFDSSGSAIGFTQLYPTFCSVAAKNAWILEDLFVDPGARRTGVGRELMDRAQQLGAETGAAWLKLETAVTNIPGQTLYESQGWERDEEFYSYYFSFKD